MTAPEFRRGLVVGKFYPLHAGHLALLRTAASRCQRLDVQVLAATVESVPGEVRADWVRAELPVAHVVAARDDAAVDYASDAAWVEHVAIIEAHLDPGHGPVDAVFTSDPYGAELARRLSATWVQVDPDRSATPVSGRAVRADVAGHWWALPAPVRAHLALRAVVLGAESTGTTTLARALAERYRTVCVPEFGREWSAVRPGRLATPWHTAEFDLIAREQARLEDDAAARAPRPLVVADTDALATAVWHERYVGTRSPTVEALAAARTPDLYLLTAPDIPFVQDGLRDGEHVRHAMHDRFREVLARAEAERGVPWVEVRGTREQRVTAAAGHVDALLARGRSLTDPLPERGVGAGILTP